MISAKEKFVVLLDEQRTRKRNHRKKKRSFLYSAILEHIILVIIEVQPT